MQISGNISNIADNNFSPIILRVLDLGRQDNRVIVFCPFRIVLVELRLDPVLVGDDSLLAV